MTWLAHAWAVLWDPIKTPAAAFVTAVISALIRRFRMRMTPLRWSVTHQNVAISAKDATFGTVEVRHNGRPMQILSMCHVEIENEGAKDLTDVDFTVSYADGTSFVMSVASLQGGKGLAFAPEYGRTADAWALVKTEDQATSPLLPYLMRIREYRAPVLNRGSKVTLTALVDVPAGVAPTATVICVHPGVRLRQSLPGPKLWGVNMRRANVIGISVALGAAIVLGAAGVPNVLSLGIAFVAGTLVTALGASVARLARLIGKMVE